jgi:hypothetical protein
VVRFQDGIAQVLQRPMVQGYTRRHQYSYWHLLYIAKLGPRDGVVNLNQ